jgi:nitrile hydratase
LAHPHHDHEHPHDPPAPTVPEPAVKAAALEALLIEKGLATTEEIDAIVRRYENELTSRNGARVVARAWTDPAFRERLLTDATTAVGEMGFGGPEVPPLVVVANEPGVQNVIVCTLCSCYPTWLLGVSPAWYKSLEYRSRVVREPRVVLAEFGLSLPPEVEVRVWDSTAELRYMVLPERPAGTEGWDEERLAALVTRNALVGVARVERPGTGAG